MRKKVSEALRKAWRDGLSMDEMPEAVLKEFAALSKLLKEYPTEVREEAARWAKGIGREDKDRFIARLPREPELRNLHKKHLHDSLRRLPDNPLWDELKKLGPEHMTAKLRSQDLTLYERAHLAALITRDAPDGLAHSAVQDIYQELRKRVDEKGDGYAAYLLSLLTDAAGPFLPAGRPGGQLKTDGALYDALTRTFAFLENKDIRWEGLATNPRLRKSAERLIKPAAFASVFTSAIAVAKERRKQRFPGLENLIIDMIVVMPTLSNPPMKVRSRDAIRRNIKRWKER